MGRIANHYIHIADKIGWIIVFGTFAFFLWEGKLDAHSGIHVLLFVCALASAGIVTAALYVRKRISAGITRFRPLHRPADAYKRLQIGQSVYFYWGWTFSTCLQDFLAATKEKIAKRARIRLLLIDPADERLMETLGKLENPPLSKPAMQAKLAKQLLTTLSALSIDPTIEFRAHRRLGRMWLHIFDDKEIVFGMVPKGQEGSVAPAIELEQVKNRSTLWDYFLETSEQAWAEAAPKDAKTWRAELEALLAKSTGAGK